MANHVYTQLDIEFINQQDTAKFSEWIGHTPPVENTTFGERIETCCNIMLDNLYPDKEDTNAYYIENLGAKILMTENMKYHVDNKTPLTENAFRYASESFINLWGFLCMLGNLMESAETCQKYVKHDYFH